MSHLYSLSKLNEIMCTFRINCDLIWFDYLISIPITVSVVISVSLTFLYQPHWDLLIETKMKDKENNWHLFLKHLVCICHKWSCLLFWDLSVLCLFQGTCSLMAHDQCCRHILGCQIAGLISSQDLRLYPPNKKKPLMKHATSMVKWFIKE